MSSLKRSNNRSDVSATRKRSAGCSIFRGEQSIGSPTPARSLPVLSSRRIQRWDLAQIEEFIRDGCKPPKTTTKGVRS